MKPKQEPTNQTITFAPGVTVAQLRQAVEKVVKASFAEQMAEEECEKTATPRRWRLPAPEQLALIAANLNQKDSCGLPCRAVDYAFAFWTESCRKLEQEIETQDYYDQETRANANIRRPDKFPATRT